MTQQPLLSICIPTYNRASYLKNCLDGIVAQFGEIPVKNLVEIVISDNASEDNTKEIVEKFQRDFTNIKYFKNETNLGLDENIIQSVVKASGKYCWNIGDDDLIQNGTLKFIVDFLSKNEVSLLTVAFHPFIDIKKSLLPIPSIPESAIELSTSPEEFYKKGHCQGILGIFIFNRDLYLKVDRKNYEPFWPYYEIILKMLPGSQLKMAYLNYPVLFIGQDYRWNTGGNTLFILIHIRRVFNKLRKFGYSKGFTDNELKNFSKGLFLTITKAKATGLNCSLDNLFLIYKEFSDYPLQLFLVTLIFFIPNPTFRFLKKLKLW